MADPLIRFQITANSEAAKAAFTDLSTSITGMAAKVKAAMAEGKGGSQALVQEIERLGAKFDGINARIQTQGAAVGRTLQGTGQHVGNVTAQFNDLGVMMASGQNPLIMALQQGTQLNQVWAQMGGGVKNVGKAMGAAFLSLLSPINLVTIGVIAGTAYLVQWAMSGGEAAKSLKEQIDDLKSAVDAYAASVKDANSSDLKSDYDAQTAQARELLRLQQQLNRLQAERAAMYAAASVRDAFGDTSRVASGPPGDSAPFAEQTLHLDASLAMAKTLGIELKGNEDTIRAIAVAFEDMKTAGDPAELAAGFDNVRGLILEATGGVNGMSDAVFAVVEKLFEAEQQTLRLQAQTEAATASFVAMAAGAIDTADNAVTLGEALWNALMAAEQIASTDIASGIRDAANEAGRFAANMWQAVQARATKWQAAENYVDNAKIIGAYQLYGDSRSAAPEIAPAAPVTSSGGSSRSGGSPTRAQTDKAKDLLKDLDLSLAAINVRVQAGLMTTAEGVEAISDAKAKTANALADLIPQLEAMGPTAAASLDLAKNALAGLAKQVDKTAMTIADTLSDAVETPFANFIRQAETGKDAMADFANSVLDQWAKLAAQIVNQQAITPLFNSIFGAMGLPVAAAVEAADGMVLAGGTQKFAAGTVLGPWHNKIVDRPTHFAMGGGLGLMGEAGPEAIIPLKSGPNGPGVQAFGMGGVTILPMRRMPDGDLGVDMARAPSIPYARGGMFGSDGGGMPSGRGAGGGGGSGGDFIVNISTPEGTTATATERTSGDDRVLDVMVRKIEGKIAGGIQRNEGPISGALQAQFNLSRKVR